MVVFLLGSILCGILLTASSIRRSRPTMLGDILGGRGAARDWMPITQIDRDMVRAAIAAEDSKFCSHHGFDYEAIENAMQRNASGGHIRGGFDHQPGDREERLPVAERRLCPQRAGGVVHLPDRKPMGQAKDHGGLFEPR